LLNKNKDEDYPPKLGILPQYAHLKGMAENMPVIRKILGLPEHGPIPTNTAIGRAVQRFVANSSQDVLRKSGNNQYKPLE
jgi:hypothetical protein